MRFLYIYIWKKNKYRKHVKCIKSEYNHTRDYNYSTLNTVSDTDKIIHIGSLYSSPEDTYNFLYHKLTYTTEPIYDPSGMMLESNMIHATVELLRSINSDYEIIINNPTYI